MNSTISLLACLLVIAQLSQASFPYEGYYEGYPALAGYYTYALADPYSYAPFTYGAHPYGYPYGLHSHYHHPRAALRNVARSFQKESGHLSETDVISPFAKKN
ncbi:hypothetical protein Y032_0211g2205 [Ancylostoma ceylanicum]|uniref:Uncharacterized protein n=1 Tax=Ancylostoma ceylanicum TaxID=53326 RepID=A0A016SKD0_9BILA|nr:hypothetical protein Y032_0211g2205 [Ancylostoma ceylanicum]